MSMPVYENLVRGYNVVLSGLKALSGDICVNCINLEVAQMKVEKGLKKLKADVQGCTVTPEDKKKELISKIDNLATNAEQIPLASECSCQKTAGLCKLETACFATDLLRLLST